MKGPAARVVTNMQASLAVPTATSVRAVPAKLLIDNRTVINNALQRGRGGKVSFTHLIGFAVVKALAAMPEMNYGFLEQDGKPAVRKPEHVNFGLAIDVQKPDGSRTLLVPSIKGAEAMDFAGFWSAYEDVVRRARNNKLTADDFAGTTISLTNPGTIGTVHSVPRLMAGQGTIIGVGAMEYPAEYQGAAPETLARLAVSKIMTLTSTYDHRIIQGAQSGDFLRRMHGLLLGEDGFYDEVFRALRIPYEPIRWVRDISASHEDDVAKQARVQELIHAYRVRGHLMADTDPLEFRQRSHPDLDVVTHGLTLWDLDREFATGGFGGKPMASLREILGVLRESYCRRIGIEYMHIQDPEERHWIQERVEVGFPKPDREDQLTILRRLNAAEAFETFLQTKYVGQKRFSLEGGESVIPLLDEVMTSAAESGLDEVTIGMPHRGRLNVLANLAGKSYAQIFREFEGNQDPRSVQGSGDVKYHLGTEGSFKAPDGSECKVYLAANPSHLEAVNPVLEGITRAKQDRIDKGEGGFTVLPVLLHGDAAFAGQGVVAETLNLSQLRGYRTGGTIHVIVNNQVGFTTSPAASRSSFYCTDVARMIQAPIFHVNGDDPEACVRVAKLAFEYRQEFKKDVVIDMVCYRRRGHNEGDDPSMTQPLMYSLIENKRSVRKIYTESLIGRGDISVEEAEQALRDYQGQLERVFSETREAIAVLRRRGHRRGHRAAGRAEHVGRRSGPGRPPYHLEVVKQIADAHVALPDGFTVHPKLMPLLQRRAAMASEGGIDWAMGELFAFGSLLLEGKPIRMAGQDSRRGTFVQRHAVLTDRATGEEWVPLAHLDEGQARFWIYDSLLSRVRRDGLRVRLLGGPAGRAGALGGAVRRLLQRRADDHRRVRVVVGAEVEPALVGRAAAAARLRGPGARPLVRSDRAVPADVRRGQHDGGLPVDAGVVLPPAALARLPPAAPAADRVHPQVDAAAQGGGLGRWRTSPPAPSARSSPRPRAASTPAPYAGSCSAPARSTTTCSRSGPSERRPAATQVAIVRVEQLAPLPGDEIAAAVGAFPQAELVWVQEEPANQGPWPFMALNLPAHLGGRGLSCISRPASASPAAGSHKKHDLEQHGLVEQAFTLPG